MLQNKNYQQQPELIVVISEKSALIRDETERLQGHILGYCDESGEWSDLSLNNDGTFTCEECRGEAAITIKNQ